VVTNSFCSFVTQLPTVVVLGFLFPSPIAKFCFITPSGIVSLVGVPSLPFI